VNNVNASSDRAQTTQDERVGLTTAPRFDSIGGFLSQRAVALISVLALVISITALVVAFTRQAKPPCNMVYHKEKVYNDDVEKTKSEWIRNGWNIEAAIPTPAGAMVEITFSRCQ
jgi:hypothetical protein